MTTVLYYAPGVLLAAAVVLDAAWCTYQRAHVSYRNRADRRTYTARAARLHQVADRAETVMALPEDQLIARLNTKYAAPHHAPKEG